MLVHFRVITTLSFTCTALEQKSLDTARSVTTPEGKCTVGGNRKCNHHTWDDFGGYLDGCCTPDQKCGIDEGDCSEDSDCHPGLVCGTRNCPKGVGFSDRADCCEPISGVFKPSKHKYILFGRSFKLYKKHRYDVMTKGYPSFSIWI